MNHQQKSLSFLMELLIVIFFFTIASSICVLVMSNAKDKQLYAKHVRTSMIYGQNLIDEENAFLYEEKFYLNEDGTPQQKESMYMITIQVKEKGVHGDLCEMHIKTQEKETAVLSFYRQEVRP